MGFHERAGLRGTNLALKTTIDPNGHQTQQVSDGLGRMIRVREFTGTGGSLTLYGETRYAYDAGDRLTTVTDAAGNVTTITYDALGRKVGMVDPDMGAWTMATTHRGS
jgi:YD repeat-containing protein